MKFDTLVEYILINHGSNDDNHDNEDQGDGYEGNFFKLKEPIVQALKDEGVDYLIKKTGHKLDMFISYLDDMGTESIEVVDFECSNQTEMHQHDDEEPIEGDWDHYALHISTYFDDQEHNFCLNFIENHLNEECTLEIE